MPRRFLPLRRDSPTGCCSGEREKGGICLPTLEGEGGKKYSCTCLPAPPTPVVEVEKRKYPPFFHSSLHWREKTALYQPSLWMDTVSLSFPFFYWECCFSIFYALGMNTTPFSKSDSTHFCTRVEDELAHMVFLFCSIPALYWASTHVLFPLFFCTHSHNAFCNPPPLPQQM